MYTSLKGSDSDFEDARQLQRNVDFKTSIIDLAVTTEFNFRDYQPTKLRKDRYSPYVSGGIGYASLLTSDVPAESATFLVFGGGFKYNIARKWSMGAEWTFRKTLNDLLDGTENIGAEEGVFFQIMIWLGL